MHLRNFKIKKNVLTQLGLSLLVLITCSCGEQSPSKIENTTGSEHSHHAAHQHHSGHMPSQSALIINNTPSPAIPETKTQLEFMIHDSDGGMVTEFDITHEKKVHLIIVSENLAFFDHIHPDIDEQGNLTAEYIFPSAGNYLFFADHKPHEKNAALATGSIRVTGDAPAKTALIPNSPGLIETSAFRAKILFTKASTLEPCTISFTLADPEGHDINDLQAYLGAMGHLVIISEDGKSYVHSHPHDQDEHKNIVTFEAHFTQTGTYKAWGQFQRNGEVKTIPFILTVE